MLLLVLLMLSLFLAAGAMLLTVATRARDAARATAAYVQPLALNDEAARAALDQALMALLRGSTSGSNGSIMTGTFCENILVDKYGESRSFQGSALSGTTSPVPTLTITATSGDLTTGTGAAPRLNGRILTIKPRPGQGDVVSFRILNAVATSASSARCYLAQLPSRSSPALVSSTMSFDVIVNGREFTPVSGTSTPEAYDAFDDANTWLAQPSLNALQTGSFGRLSISGSAIQLPTVDNDNDGVPDGVWVSGTAGPGGVIGTVVAPQPSPLGGSVSYDVSYLILDLDGRININTAGMARPAAGSYAGTPDAPLGMGYGPADIDASLVVAGDLPSPSGTSEFTGGGSSPPPGKWTTILLSGSPSTDYQTTYHQRRMPPRLGTIEGRYGANNVSGTSGDDVDDYQRTSAANYPLLIAGSNAVGDLQGQLKLYMQPPSSATDLTPTLSFVAVASGTDAVDDPYEVRLDADAPRFGTARRPAAVAGNDDSPFTIAELERVLRANDPDASQLPARLAAALEDRAQAVRMTITTESWDTPALTGTAARLIEDLVGGAGAGMLHDAATWASGSNSLSPDIAAGLRFNINRPLLSGTSVAARKLQHEYCKGIYTLALALGETNKARAAQWAVNVLDFRDDDSNITGFEYDTNLANGWNVDGDCGTTGDTDRAVVWGVERPEVMIAEVAAWREPRGSQPDSQLFVNLHRPACNAVIGKAASGSVSVTGTTERSRLTDANGVLQLSATTSGTSAVWQMVISPSQAGGSGTVQFVVPPAAGVMGSTTGVAQLAASGTGAYLCVTPASPQNFSVNAIPTFAITTGGTFGFLPTSASGTVQLQRLANPTAAWSATTNPYITVDEAAIVSIPQKMPPPSGAFVPPLFKNRRRMPADGGADPLTGFWRRDWLPDAAASGAVLGPLSVSGSTHAAWFHWPNRPFVSSAELALVPADDATTMLKNYAFPTTSLASGTTPASLAMLDATHVPTLFAGHALTVSGSAVSDVGLNVLGMHQMSKWREPGRVNVNTILSGTTAVDEVVWAALVGGTQTMLRTGTITTNPFTTVVSGSLSPATSFAQLLSVSGSAQQPPAQRVFASGTSPRVKNPFLAYDVPIRLANTATIRSNVFAVWITVRVTDDSPNAGPPIIKRLFAIVDRSIPVGYSPGSDLNVRDCIRLSRYLD